MRRDKDKYPENAAEQKILTSAELGFREVGSVSYSRYTKNWRSMPPHIHRGCLEICYCRRGSLNFECGGKPYTVLPDNVFLSQPGDVHRLTNNHKGVICYWMMFRYPMRGETVFGMPPAESRELVRRLRRIDRHLFAVDHEFQSVFKAVFEAAKAPRGPWRTFRLRTLFQRLMLLLTDNGANAPTIDGLKAIDDFARLMRCRPHQPFTTIEMAEHVHLSESRFTALFRQVTGLPPHAYLLHCRMDEVRQRLSETEDSVTKIANDLGFSSAQHLATQFFRTFRKSPTAYRRESKFS